MNSSTQRSSWDSEQLARRGRVPSGRVDPQVVLAALADGSLRRERQAFIEADTLDPETARTYDNYVNHYLQDVADWDAPELDPLEVDTLMAWMAHRGLPDQGDDNGDGVSPWSHGRLSPVPISRTVVALRRYVQDTDYAEALLDPEVDDLRQVIREAQAELRPQTPLVIATADDVRALMSVQPEPRPYWSIEAKAVISLFVTGLTLHEIASLRPDDTDLSAAHPGLTVMGKTIALQPGSEALLCPINNCSDLVALRGEGALFPGGIDQLHRVMRLIRRAARRAGVTLGGFPTVPSADLLKVAAHCDPPYMRWTRNRLLVILAFLGGMRMASTRRIRRIKRHPEGVLVWLPYNKHSDKPLLVAIAKTSDPLLCPLRALQRWIEIGGPRNGWLFPCRNPNRSAPLTMDGADLVVRTLSAAAGVRVTPHSLRRGFINEATLAGYTIASICRKTGQRPSSAALYVAATYSGARIAALRVGL